MRKLNWVRGPSSPLKYSNKLLEVLPPYKSLTSLQSPVYDQGTCGSCTGNAIASALEFLQLQQIRNVLGKGPEEFSGLKYDPISRLFIYYNERALEGHPYDDGGASIYTGIYSIAQHGFCQESTWPYVLDKMYWQPSRAAYAEASMHKELDGYSLEDGNLHQIKQCIASGYPVVFGTEVYQSFIDINSNSVYPGPYQWERPLGGHCLLIVGYNDTRQCMTVKNSWGRGYGDRGYAYLSYDFAAGFADMHVIK